MGGVHLRSWQAIAGAKVVAVCDINPIESQGTSGNLDIESRELDLEGIAIYTDVAELLSNENLDAVSVTLPTHLHKAISIQALESGAHVLCEKPMALDVRDCDLMVEAASKAGKYLMVAHCIRFWPEYVWAKRVIESGEYGKVMAADFQRLSAPPVGWNGSWFMDDSKSGGVVLDLHIHDLDYIQYLFGVPQKIQSTSSCLDNGVQGHVVSVLDYGDNRTVSATGSWIMPPSFGFKMGFDIVLETGLLVFDSRAETMLKVYPSEGDSFAPEIDEGDAYEAEIEYFFSVITGANKEVIVTPEQSRESVSMAVEVVKKGVLS